jgi:fumarate reductase flavoprotein subunit
MLDKKIWKGILGIALTVSVILGCSTTGGETGLTFNPGTYEASARGMYGPVTVSVTVTEKEISSVVVKSHQDTGGLGDIAAEKLPPRIVAAQSLAVDVVSGATITSSAIMAAVEKALGQSGADLSVLYTAPANVPLKRGKSENFDVVIVGAGLAGLNAAYDLKINHPEITFVVLEQLDIIGGSLPMAGGAIIATSSKYHKAEGIECTLDDIILLVENAIKQPSRRTLVRNVFGNSQELFDRYIDWGLEFTTPYQSRPANNPKVYAFRAKGWGAGFAQFFNRHIQEDPINLRLRSCVTDLITADGGVTGVTVRDSEKEYEIYAKAVLLASGGFGQNQDLIAQYAPLFKGGFSQTNAGAKGAGFIMTRRFNTPVVGEGLMGGRLTAFTTYSAIPSNFIVSKEGKRFVDESNDDAVINALGGGRVTGYKLADGSFAAEGKLITNVHLAPNVDHRDAGLTGYNTLEELAGAHGIDATNLINEVKNYNTAVDRGESPGFGLPAGKATKIETPPYYAEQLYTVWYGTVPGIKIDDTMHVLDGSDRPVPGLYAAGEVAEGNLWTVTYPGGGTGIGFAIFGGAFAARQIASDLK